MPTSSTAAVYGNSTTDNKLQVAAFNSRAQPVAIAGIPNSPNYTIDHFLSDNDKTTAACQRRPIEFRQIQNEAKAETVARARMLAQLDAFDKKFASSGSQTSSSISLAMD
ncbi:hypothetical protein V8C42DRAFT_328480 [Trichoderma barbatum]